MRWLFPFQMNSLFFFFNDQCLKYHLLFYLFIYLFGHVCRMWNFLGQGSNPWHSSDLSRCSDNVRSLTHCATRELQNTICSYMQFTAYSFRERKYYILWDMFLKMNVIDMLQDFFFFFFFFGYAFSLWKFLGQELNLCHGSYLSHCSDNTGFLTSCATRECLFWILKEFCCYILHVFLPAILPNIMGRMLWCR